MTVSAAVTDQRGWMKITVTGVASTDSAGIGTVANPEGVTLGITRAFAYFRTGSTGAATFDIGIGALATTNTVIADFAAVIQGTVGGKMYFCPTAQVAVTENPITKWLSTTYVTFTSAQSTAGLDADLYLEYIRLA